MQTCLELERYLQTEPKRLSELFDQDLDGLLTPAYLKEDGEEDLPEALLPGLPEPPSPPPVTLCPLRQNLTSTKDLKPKGQGPETSDGTEGVHLAQLSAVTSLTPPSSPELGRHLVKPSQTLTASADGTLTLKLVARKVGLSAARLVTGHALPVQVKEEEEGAACLIGGELPENKKRIHRCQFNGCRKVYTKSSHLKAHQRTHTVVCRHRLDCSKRPADVPSSIPPSVAGPPLMGFTHHTNWDARQSFNAEVQTCHPVSPLLVFQAEPGPEPAEPGPRAPRPAGHLYPSSPASKSTAIRGPNVLLFQE